MEGHPGDVVVEDEARGDEVVGEDEVRDPELAEAAEVDAGFGEEVD